jgi:hypothetical protein
MDTYHNVYVGTHNVLMEITNAIPSRLLIAGHWCNVFYVGQTPTCFTCHKSGHSSHDCPSNRVNNLPVVAPNGVDPGTINTVVLQSNASKNTAHASTTNLHASKTISPPSDRGGVAPPHMHTHLASRTVDHPDPCSTSAVAPAGDPPVVGENSKAYSEAVKEPLKPSLNNASGASDDDDDEFVDVAEFPMAVDPVSHKRDRSDSDSSDNSAGHLDKRGKALIVGTVAPGDGNLKDLFSPNLFSPLHDEVADLPLPVNEDDLDGACISSPQRPKPPRGDPSAAPPESLADMETPIPPIPSILHSPSAPPVFTDDYDGDDDSDDDESLAMEKNLDNPQTPVSVD